MSHMPQKTSSAQHYSGESRIPQRSMRQSLGGGRQPIISPIFPENCMKMEKFRPGGTRVPCAPLRSATDICPVKSFIAHTSVSYTNDKNGPFPQYHCYMQFHFERLLPLRKCPSLTFGNCTLLPPLAAMEIIRDRRLLRIVTIFFLKLLLSFYFLC